MTQPTPSGLAPFTKQDVQTILAIIDNQPLQNGTAARQIAALAERFSVFCVKNLGAAAQSE